MSEPIERDGRGRFSRYAKDPWERLSGKIEQGPECWEWRGARNWAGYGQSSLYGKVMQAHRAVYLLLVGPIPDGYQLDHLCRNRGCVNPDHLEPVTARINLLRSTGITAIQAAQTHCKRRHPLSGSNLRVRTGKRFCHQCAMDYQRERRRKVAS
jgi:hypothetical protein